MCHGRTINKKIYRLHERCLRIVYDNKKSPLQELLEIDKSILIQIKNLQVQATEMLKVFRNICPLS